MQQSWLEPKCGGRSGVASTSWSTWIFIFLHRHFIQLGMSSRALCWTSFLSINKILESDSCLSSPLLRTSPSGLQSRTRLAGSFLTMEYQKWRCGWDFVLGEQVWATVTTVTSPLLVRSLRTTHVSTARPLWPGGARAAEAGVALPRSRSPKKRVTALARGSPQVGAFIV